MALQPDFLCIGMQRAGTEFLFNLLDASSLFWMPPIKEFHHFDGSATKSRPAFNRTLAKAAEIRRKRGRRSTEMLLGQAPADDAAEATQLFCLRYEAYRQAGCSDEAYCRLFEVCPEGRLTGDITPGYSTLEPPAIARVGELLPEVAIILVIRDPVSRAWSHFNLRIRRNLERSRTPPPAGEELAAAMHVLMTDRAELEAFLGSDSVQRRAYPSRIYRNWAEVLGAERIKLIFFEDLIGNPRQAFDSVARFVLNHRNLTADKLLACDSPLPEPPGNRKEQHIRIPLEAAQRATLVETFADELAACRELFGEPVQAWLGA